MADNRIIEKRNKASELRRLVAYAEKLKDAPKKKARKAGEK